MSTTTTREKLKSAVDNGEVLTVIYHGGTQPGTKRQIAPVGLVGEHLRALALPQEETRTYFVDKLQIVSDDYDAPAYDPSVSLKQDKKSSKSLAGQEIAIEIDLSQSLKGPPSAAPEEKTHALPGSYDTSCFRDPETCSFRFPKYDTGSESLVRIKDKTRYNRDNFSTLEDVPLREYTIDDFEHDFMEAEFEVASIECLFRPKNKDHFAPFDYLTRSKAEVDALQRCLEDHRQNPYVVAESRAFSQLEHDGFIEELALSRNLVLRQLDSQYKKADLVAIAEKTGVPSTGLKADLLARLLEASQLKPKKTVRPTERFEALIVALVDIYLSDIRKNIDHFHPLYLEWVWEEVSDANWDQWEYLSDRIDEIRNEKYWLNRLTVPASQSSQRKKWWKFWS
jgi:hypothetical protein